MDYVVVKQDIKTAQTDIEKNKQNGPNYQGKNKNKFKTVLNLPKYCILFHGVIQATHI